MTGVAQRATPSATVAAERPGVGRSLVGGLFLVTGGVHLGIVMVDAGFYRHFADEALFPFVRAGWDDVFMAAPTFWGLCLMAGEIVLGSLLLLGGPWAKAGWVGVIAFHLLLMFFGFGFFLWSIPMLCLLAILAVRDWPRLSTRSGT